MNFFSQFRLTSNPHVLQNENDIQASNTSEGILMERPEAYTQPPAFAYIATTNSALEQTHDPVVSENDHEEDESESQPAQDFFLAELLGLAFLIAFHGSVFLLKHVYVIALTLLSYVDNDIEKKYLTHV